ncbi:FmdE family protein [Chloroflexota bacterium]
MYSIEEYCKKSTDFHGGHLAPGMIIAGFMVDMAYQNLPGDSFFDVICETVNCLPDAVQLLTPCTIGNQWMKIIDVGRYAMTFYDKYNGEGMRVHLDISKLEQWPAIRDWFLKLKPKQEQDKDVLISEIVEAGTSILGIEEIRISQEFMANRKKKPVGICPVCNEAFRSDGEVICPACKEGYLPYFKISEQKQTD